MKTTLFYLIIYPIIFILEFVFSLVYEMIGSAGYSVLAVSLVVSIMTLPMYMQSDALQEKEREAEEKLAPGISHIR